MEYFFTQYLIIPPLLVNFIPFVYTSKKRREEIVGILIYFRKRMADENPWNQISNPSLSSDLEQYIVGVIGFSPLYEKVCFYHECREYSEFRWYRELD